MLAHKEARVPCRDDAGECFRAKDRTPRFPRCQLHERRIVDAFPAGCPFSLVDPLDAIRALQDRGWDRLCRIPDGNITGGHSDLHRTEVCMDCIGRLSRHQVVRRFRRLAGVEVEL